MNKASLIALSMGLCLSASVWAADSNTSSSNSGTPVVVPSTNADTSNQHDKADQKVCDKKKNMKDCEKSKKAEGKCGAGKCSSGNCSGASK